MAYALAAARELAAADEERAANWRRRGSLSAIMDQENVLAADLCVVEASQRRSVTSRRGCVEVELFRSDRVLSIKTTLRDRSPDQSTKRHDSIWGPSSTTHIEHIEHNDAYLSIQSHWHDPLDTVDKKC